MTAARSFGTSARQTAGTAMLPLFSQCLLSFDSHYDVKVCQGRSDTDAIEEKGNLLPAAGEGSPLLLSSHHSLFQSPAPATETAPLTSFYLECFLQESPQ